MTSADTRQRVIALLSVMSGVPEAEIGESSKLDDLGLTVAQRAALAPGFKELARQGNPGAVITLAACKQLRTVKQCVDLVQAAAQERKA